MARVAASSFSRKPQPGIRHRAAPSSFRSSGLSSPAKSQPILGSSTRLVFSPNAHINPIQPSWQLTSFLVYVSSFSPTLSTTRSRAPTLASLLPGRSGPSHIASLPRRMYIQQNSHLAAMMGDAYDAYPPIRDSRRVSAPFSQRDGGRYRDRRDDDRRDRSMDRSWDMRRDRDRSRSRERLSPRDRDLNWNRRPPPNPPRLDTGNRSPGSSTPQLNAVNAPCESALDTLDTAMHHIC